MIPEDVYESCQTSLCTFYLHYPSGGVMCKIGILRIEQINVTADGFYDHIHINILLLHFHTIVCLYFPIYQFLVAVFLWFLSMKTNESLTNAVCPIIGFKLHCMWVSQQCWQVVSIGLWILGSLYMCGATLRYGNKHHHNFIARLAFLINPTVFLSYLKVRCLSINL